MSTCANPGKSFRSRREQPSLLLATANPRPPQKSSGSSPAGTLPITLAFTSDLLCSSVTQPGSHSQANFCLFRSPPTVLSNITIDYLFSVGTLSVLTNGS